MGQMRDKLGLCCAGLIATGVLGACGADAAGEGSVAQASEALVVSNCTGAAISAAIMAGGNIVLSCGSAPITIPMPFTPVAKSVQLTAAVPRTVTFSHPSLLFQVQSGVTFNVSGISFNGALPTTGSAFNAVSSGTTLTISNATFTQSHGPLIVHAGAGASLTVSNTTFEGNTGAG
ncbi:MAG TPA: hypothetical protein VJV79_17235 [Polyangiaceae bacterium]|nr:hypothetical protein [Polyangiaceae bacterium]